MGLVQGGRKWERKVEVDEHLSELNLALRRWGCECELGETGERFLFHVASGSKVDRDIQDDCCGFVDGIRLPGHQQRNDVFATYFCSGARVNATNPGEFTARIGAEALFQGHRFLKCRNVP